MAEARGRLAAIAIFRYRNFRLYMAGHGLSLVGLWLHRVAVGWLAWDLTGSGTWLGVIAMVDLAPAVVLGPIAGALADRFDRRRLAQLFQIVAMIQAVLLAALSFAGVLDIWLLAALTLALGVNQSFWQPARLALVPSLVPRADLATAIAVNAVVFNVARFLGPAAAGAIIVWAGVGWAFLANAVSYLAFIYALAVLSLPPPATADRRHGIFADMVQGIRYALRHPGISPLLLLLAAFAVLVRPVVELLPGFAEAVFARGAGGLAIMTSTMGAGALVAGLWLARRGGGDLMGLVATAGSVGALVLFAFAATSWFAFALACLAVAAFCQTCMGVGGQTLLQSAIDDVMRGRVLSFYGMIFRGGPALGAVAMGTASEVTGLQVPVALGALIGVAACALAYRRRHALALALAPPSP